MSDNNVIHVDPEDFKNAFKNSPETPIDLKAEAENESADVPETEKEEKNTVHNRLLNALRYMRDNYDLQYNEMSTKIEYKRKSDKEYSLLDDREYEDIRMRMRIQGKIFISANDYKGLLSYSDIVKKVNPIKDYMYDHHIVTGKQIGRAHV